ncbi:hypothetical protein FVE85_5376 [Porphyridium purpureum]|uniref:Uncharacterized protein n=1 Tax=Porphyridium purpureum TaxID=35688 RepID=A0A5J4Z1R7_PORPP|nr:hypothetical protein FVE85_5376 [Porphyridium purpureum]|eukprot:POR4081..scf295_1
MKRGMTGALALVLLATLCVSVHAYEFTVSYTDCMSQFGARTIPAARIPGQQTQLKTDLVANGADPFVADVLSSLFFTSMPKDPASGDYCYTHAKRLQLFALNDLTFGTNSTIFVRDEEEKAALDAAEAEFYNMILALEANATSTQSAETGAYSAPATGRQYDDIVQQGDVYVCATSNQQFVHQGCAQEACAFCDTSAATNSPEIADGCLGRSLVVHNVVTEPPYWSKRFDWRRRVYLNCLFETHPTWVGTTWAMAGVGDALSFSENMYGNACPPGGAFALFPACVQLSGSL